MGPPRSTLEQHHVVHWRLVDLRDAIDRQFGVLLHERTVGKLMARLNLRACRCARVIPHRTWTTRRHTKNFAAVVNAAIPEHARGKPIELWWQDEAVSASKAA